MGTNNNMLERAAAPDGPSADSDLGVAQAVGETQKKGFLRERTPGAPKRPFADGDLGAARDAAVAAAAAAASAEARRAAAPAKAALRRPGRARRGQQVCARAKPAQAASRQLASVRADMGVVDLQVFKLG